MLSYIFQQGHEVVHTIIIIIMISSTTSIVQDKKEDKKKNSPHNQSTLSPPPLCRKHRRAPLSLDDVDGITIIIITVQDKKKKT